MVIKKMLFLLLLFLSLQGLSATKENSWIHYKNLGEGILSEIKIDVGLTKRIHEFRLKKKELDDMEYKENETYALSQRVEDHWRKLNEEEFSKQYEVSVSYLSFQREIDFKNDQGKSKLILTNNAFCFGGSYGITNQRTHYWLDACAFYGKSNVGSENTSLTFEQDNIDSFGLKISPGIGIYASAAKSEIGFRTPFLYSRQNISKPAGTSLTKGSDLQLLGTFYLRFPIQKWFFSLEFGKVVSQDVTLWSLGTGFPF